MLKVRAAVAALVLAILSTDGMAIAAPLSDAQVRAAVIRESLAGYPGPCPCPYNAARNGSACGRRSAYNRPGGYAPKCYPRDVSRADVEAYRRTQAR